MTDSTHISSHSRSNTLSSSIRETLRKVSSSQVLKKTKPIRLFTVALDDNRTIYLPGQRVEGHVSVDFNIPTHVRLLRVRIHGQISIQFTRSDACSSIILFKDICNLGGTGLTDEYQTVFMPIGESVFPFSFRLPASALPSTFDGSYGKIRYEVTAILIVPGISKRTFVLPITIPSTISPETMDGLLETVSLVTEFPTKSLWGWKTGQVQVQCSLPKAGYQSEEIAPLTLEIINHSKHSILIKDFSIKQKVKYRLIHEIKGPRTEIIHKIPYNEVFPSSVRKITRFIQIPIPNIHVLSPFIDTPILSVTHFICCKVSAGHSTVKICIPTTICGFPWQGFDLDRRMSIETLPIYEGKNVDFVDQETCVVTGNETSLEEELLNDPGPSCSSSIDSTPNNSIESIMNVHEHALELRNRLSELQLQEEKELKNKDSAVLL